MEKVEHGYRVYVFKESIDMLPNDLSGAPQVPVPSQPNAGSHLVRTHPSSRSDVEVAGLTTTSLLLVWGLYMDPSTLGWGPRVGASSVEPVRLRRRSSVRY